MSHACATFEHALIPIFVVDQLEGTQEKKLLQLNAEEVEPNLSEPVIPGS